MEPLDFRPVVTYAGDCDHFLNFQSDIQQAILAEKAEWRRSYGRPPKSVTLNPKFEKFTDDISADDIRLRDKRILHIFWTCCSDVDQYKSSIKEEIQAWLGLVKAKEFSDWLIVCFESIEASKKTTKLLPRTTVLERIKSEIASKHTERCFSVCEPSRGESVKQPEIWSNFIHKFRYFFMQSFNKMVAKYEEFARNQREKRNERSWDFRDYFLLQDELGLLFQSMGMLEEALLVYDELDVMFSQFVQDSTLAGAEHPKWLESFKKTPKTWASPQLSTLNIETPGVITLDQSVYCNRLEIAQKSCSIFDFRNYLFSQQGAIILSGYKTTELAKRCCTLMQNCLVELRHLAVVVVNGSIQAWIVLMALDGVKYCQKLTPYLSAGDSSRYTAAMWDMAKDKLYDLGVACGLHPKHAVQSEHLHYLATLSSGFSVDSSDSVATLQQALANTEQFRKLYSDFCEMAISAYKHNGLARNARFIGKRLSEFLKEIGEPQKAAQFLSDVVRSYEEESWSLLHDVAQKDLVKCYTETGEKEKALLACARLIAKSKSLEVQKESFALLLKEAEQLEETVRISDMFRSASAQFPSAQLKIINKQNCPFEFELLFDTLVPSEVSFDSLKVLFEKITENRYFHNSPGAIPVPEPGLVRSASDRNFNLITQLNIKELVSHQQDGTVSSVGVTCLNPQKLYVLSKPKQEEQEETDDMMEIITENVVVKPGENRVIVKGKIAAKGSYLLSKMELSVGKLVFQHRFQDSKANVISVSDDKLAVLAKSKRKSGLLAGFPQEMSLVIHSGSFSFSEPFCLCLRASLGMKLGIGPEKADFTSDLQIEFPALGALQSCEKVLWVYTDVTIQKETTLHHKLVVQIPQVETGVFSEIAVDFALPFTASFKLHVVELTKFLNFNVHGLASYEDEVELCEPNLIIRPPGGDPLNLNIMNVGTKSLKVFQDFNATYLWEMKEYPTNCKMLKAEFSVEYRTKDSCWSTFRFPVDLTDFCTLLKLKAHVTPAKGVEYCRAGSVCSLVITVEPYATETPSLEAVMYEVLQEQNMWAVCGRTAGVMNLEGKSQQVTVEVMPLIGGYLPLPTIRLSKYIPSKSGDIGSQGLPRLEPFAPGQVYSASKSMQVHVLAVSGFNADQSLT